MSQLTCQSDRLTVRGHVIHWKRDMRSASSQAEATVSSKPPRNPSQVFLGEILIRGVLPKQMPAGQWHRCGHSILDHVAGKQSTGAERIHASVQHNKPKLCPDTGRVCSGALPSGSYHAASHYLPCPWMPVNQDLAQPMRCSETTAEADLLLVPKTQCSGLHALVQGQLHTGLHTSKHLADRCRPAR